MIEFWLGALFLFSLTALFLMASSKTLGLALLLSLVALTLGLYHHLGAVPDIRLALRLQGLSVESSSSVDEYRSLMGDIERRAAQRPGNLRYQAILGRFYMNEEDYDRARQLYLGLAEAAPEDASAVALAAQAGYMVAGGTLDRGSQLLAERALSLDPHQRTALGLLGMASYESGQYRAAVSYWERLLVLEDPQSPPAQVIRGVIERARQKAEGGTDTENGPGQK